MQLSEKEQIINMISKKGKILIVSHAKPDGDTISSALALKKVLNKLKHKNVQIACADPLPEVFEFLPFSEEFKQKTEFKSDFVLSINTKELELSNPRWRKNSENIKIIFSVDEGKIDESRINLSEKKGSFGLIISVDVADLEQLGSLFTKNTEMFAETPLINIDHHVSNTNFASVNMVSPSCASATAVLYSLIESMEKHFNKNLIDEDIATLLLTGIITDTGSFQNPNTTPKSFEIAAELIDRGARQQDIIRRLFKTKNLSTLKLWGRVLSKIKNDPINRLVWSSVSQGDLADANASSDELTGILDDLLSSAPGAEVVLLLKEREDDIVAGSLRTTSNAIDATEIADIFGGGGHRQAAGFKIPKKGRGFMQIVDEVVDRIKYYQSRRLGILIEDEKVERTIKPDGIREPKKEYILDFSSKKEDSTDIKKVISDLEAQEIFKSTKNSLSNVSLDKAGKNVKRKKNRKKFIKK